MANLTQDYQTIVSVKALVGDVSVDGVIVSFALQTLVALACILFFSFLRPRGSNRFIYQPRQEFAKDAETSPDPISTRLLDWLRPVFSKHTIESRVSSLGLDATMYLEMNKALFVTHLILAVLGIPYILLNSYFGVITGLAVDNGIQPSVNSGIASNGSVVISPTSPTTTIAQLPPSATQKAMTTTAPRPPVPTSAYNSVRCGISWEAANATCGATCGTNLDCSGGLKCYKDVISCGSLTSRTLLSFRDENSFNNSTYVNSSLIVPSSLNSLTITQINPKSAWYWIPTFMTWVFSLVVYGMLYKLCQLYIMHRRFYFSTPEFRNSLSHRTLLLTFLPKVETNDDLIAYLHAHDPSLAIEEATINRNVSKLGKLVSEHKEKTKELERYLMKVFEEEDLAAGVVLPKENVQSLENEEEGLSSALMAGTKHHVQIGDSNDGEANKESHNHVPHNTMEYQFQSKTEKFKENLAKQFRTKAKTHQQRVDEIKALEHEINHLNDEIEKIRSTPEHEHPSNSSGFLSLKTPEQAHRLVRTLKFHREYIRRFDGLHIKFAPEFPDIVWANIGRPPNEIYVRRFFAVAATVAITVAWILLLGLLSSLQNLNSFFQNNASASAWLQANPGWTSFIQTFLCPIPIALCNILLPHILNLITFLQGVKSGSGRDRSVLYKNYGFTMIQVFLFALISGMIQNGANNSLPPVIVTDPAVRQIVVAVESLAQNSYFYITMLASFYAGFGAEILQGTTLVISFVREKFFKLTPREQYELNGSVYMDFIQFYGILITAFTITLTFSIIAPFILPFAAIFFGIMFVVMKYQLLYVYSIELETHGSYFPKLFNIFTTSTLFFQLITLLVVFAGNATTTYNSDELAPTFRQWMALVPLPILTAALWIWARLYKIPQGLYCVDDFMPLRGTDFEAAVSTKPTKNQPVSLEYSAFNADFVRPLPEVLLPAQYAARVSQYYTPRARAKMDPNNPRVRAWALSLPSVEKRKAEAAKRILRGNRRRGNAVGTFDELIAMSIDKLMAIGGILPEEKEEMNVQERVLLIERMKQGALDSLGDVKPNEPPVVRVAEVEDDTFDGPFTILEEVVLEAKEKLADFGLFETKDVKDAGQAKGTAPQGESNVLFSQVPEEPIAEVKAATAETKTVEERVPVQQEGQTDAAPPAKNEDEIVIIPANEQLIAQESVQEVLQLEKDDAQTSAEESLTAEPAASDVEPVRPAVVELNESQFDTYEEYVEAMNAANAATSSGSAP